MLIAAFKVQALRGFPPFALLEGCIGGFQIRVRLADGIPTDAGVEPDIQNVGLFAEGCATKVAFICMKHLQLVRKKRVDSVCVPSLNSISREQIHDFLVEIMVNYWLITFFAHENGNGHTPNTLAADAPVGACSDHVLDTLFTPFRIPFHFFNLFDSKFTKSNKRSVWSHHQTQPRTWHRFIKRDKPLLGGAENDRMVAAPAMRVGVFQVAHGQQRATLFHHGHNDRVGGPHLHAVEGRRRGQRPGFRINLDAAGGIDTADGIDVVADAGVKILRAVRRSRVYRAGAGVGGDIGG